MNHRLIPIFLGLICCAPFAQAQAKPSSVRISSWTAHPPYSLKAGGTTEPSGYQPSQIRHAYGFDLSNATGKGQLIAIVDAYDNPAAQTDLAAFISRFGLAPMNGLPGRPSCTLQSGPHPCFATAYPAAKPPANKEWAVESNLDLQWAHAIAPGADLLLEEASSSSLTSLMQAVDAAAKAKPAALSLSWGGQEFKDELSYAAHFAKPGLSVVAASGDNGTGTSFPAVLSGILAVGGTSLTPAGKETAWKGSGGGTSKYLAAPAYQVPFLKKLSGAHRAIPDVSYHADPAYGYSVYSSQHGGWLSVGGTSAGTPQWAALLALAKELNPATSLSNADIYQAAASNYAANFRDIKKGSNGTCKLLCATASRYDPVTGLGSPKAHTLLNTLAGR